jgi:Cu-Zn family superoxide dismutase
MSCPSSSSAKKTDRTGTNTTKAIATVAAIAVFDGRKIKGTVQFTEEDNGRRVRIDVDLIGLKKNHRHGFHVHESGDITQGCESMCAHFNPYGKKHGDIDSRERHVGDLGNLETDENGRVKCTFRDSMIRLRGYRANILGRGLIIHADEDDGGHGDNAASLVNGNAGKRIACSVIGLRS